MASTSAQQTGGMEEDSKRDDSHSPTSAPPVPECNLNRPINGNPQEDSVVQKKTCWQQLLEIRAMVYVYCLSLPDSPAAMFFYGLLALSPVVDVLSDILTAANFALRGHPWWATLTLVVFYMSGRFTVVFLALCPIPTARNIVCLYFPLCWPLAEKSEAPGARVEGDTGGSETGAADPIGNPQPPLPHNQPPEENADLENPRTPGAGSQRQDEASRSCVVRLFVYHRLNLATL